MLSAVSLALSVDEPAGGVGAATPARSLTSSSMHGRQQQQQEEEEEEEGGASAAMVDAAPSALAWLSIDGSVDASRDEMAAETASPVAVAAVDAAVLAVGAPDDGASEWMDLARATER